MLTSIQPPQFLLTLLAGWLNRRQLDVIEYLREENQLLKERLGGRRLRFTQYVLVVIEHHSRRFIYFNVTAHPPAQWARQELRDARPGDFVEYSLIISAATER